VVSKSRTHLSVDKNEDFSSEEESDEEQSIVDPDGNGESQNRANPSASHAEPEASESESEGESDSRHVPEPREELSVKSTQTYYSSDRSQQEGHSQEGRGLSQTSARVSYSESPDISTRGVSYRTSESGGRSRSQSEDLRLHIESKE